MPRVETFRSGGEGPLAWTASSLPRDVSALAWKSAFLAFATHLLFVLVVLALSAWSRSGLYMSELYMYADSEEYIKAAENLVQHGSFSRERASPYLWEPYRTPGYPLLIAGVLAVTGKPTAVLLLAPFFAALLAYSVVCLTWELFLHRRAARFAGAAAAFFPNGLGLSGAILTDFVHGCVFVAAVRETLRAIRCRSIGAGALAGACWMSAQLIRPTLSLAPLLITVVALWLARDRRQIAVAALLLLLSFPVPLYLSWRNLEAHGVFAPSLLGEKVLADHAILRAEAMATRKPLEQLRREVQNKDEAAALKAGGRSVYGRLYSLQQRRVAQTIARHRLYVALEIALETARQTLAPWDFLLIALFGRTVPIAQVLFACVYFVFLGLAVAGSSIAVQRVGLATPALFWFLFLFWTVTGSVTTGAGSRLRFPGDLILIPLAAIGLAGMPELLRRFQSLRAVHDVAKQYALTHESPEIPNEFEH